LADGSCFGKVIPALQAEGYEVVAANTAWTRSEATSQTVPALGRVSAPAILVGHSYGGTVITAAGTDERVAGLVYIAALAPDDGETSADQQSQFPVTDIFSHIDIADGRSGSPERRRVLRGRPVRGGAEGRLGDPTPRGRRPVQSEG